MKLKTAIEILTPASEQPEKGKTFEFQEALKLLIEAGERIQRQRSDKHCSPTKPLPGETT